MKGSTDKCHLIWCKLCQEIQIGKSLIKNICEKFGRYWNWSQTFDNHVNNSSKKTNNKLRALARSGHIWRSF